jgi:predicted TPR repeat methyltransferase
MEHAPPGPQEPQEPQEISLEDAIRLAVLLQKHGQLAQADEIYSKVLKLEPDHPDALHYAGVLAHQQGHSDEGVAMIERSLDLMPDRADCYNNLGIIFRARGRLEEAAAAYQRAIALDPDHANAHCNLGVLYRTQGKSSDAEAAYRAAIRLNPEYIDAYHNLGVLLASLGRTREAVVCHCKVTTLAPRHPEARRLLAMAYCTLGEPHKAVEVVEEWLREDPGNPVAQHTLAACSGRDVPARASDAYVERVFDAFAPSFDEKLTRLLYRAPALVGDLVAAAGLEASKNLDVLDAGCGTGMCGSFVAPYARRLIGVDLSGGMLAKAGERHLYDELVRAELTEYMRAHPGTFDLIVSADTLVYFGALEEVLSAASYALRAGGMLIFTIEEWVDAGDKATFRICPHGRYGHAAGYVERSLRHAGLQPDIARAELRLESGSPVSGLAVSATRTN